jgi:hypothetical protein
MLKDRPRQEQEMKEMQAKEKEEAQKQAAKDLEEWKSQVKLKDRKKVEAYLTKRNITATKAPWNVCACKRKGNGSLRQTEISYGKICRKGYGNRYFVSSK